MTEARLAEESFLTDAFLGQLISVGELDILVGVPTHNDAKTIGSIVETIQAGILRFFPRERAAIINADGGSRDGTPELVVNAAIGEAQLQAVRPPYTAFDQHTVCEQPRQGDGSADHFGGCRIVAGQSVRGDFTRIDWSYSGFPGSSPAARLRRNI
jgi:glycosyltransferase involved in cell wall biosynthesis